MGGDRCQNRFNRMSRNRKRLPEEMMDADTRAQYLYWRTTPATNGAIEDLKHEVFRLRQTLEKLLAKAIARWRVVGDMSDEELHEDSVACRFLNRRIAELTEEFVPDAVAAIKALGAEPAELATLQRSADEMREALEAFVALDDGCTHVELFDAARAALKALPPQEDRK